MDKQCAIFDMDGTLVDSMGFWNRLAVEYLQSKGVAEIPAELPERIKPMTMAESGALFKAEFGLAGNPEEEMNAMMERHYRQDVPLKPGVRAYLERLRRRDVRMCVVSATAEPLVAACLERLEVLPYFEFLLSCEAVGAGKSSPLIYREAAGRLGVLPEDVVVYEDALYALQSAKKAGCHVVAVYDDSGRKSWNLMAGLANEVIINWEDVSWAPA